MELCLLSMNGVALAQYCVSLKNVESVNQKSIENWNLSV